MILKFADGNPFATGAAGYTMPGENEADQRITIEIEVEGHKVRAVVDTGAPYVVCHPDVANQIGLDPDDAIPTDDMTIRKMSVKGGLHRLNVTLLAEQGSGLSLSATAFVPNPEEDYAATLLPRSFLGLISCLESIRFAVDPFNQTFYFGEYPQ